MKGFGQPRDTYSFNAARRFPHDGKGGNTKSIPSMKPYDPAASSSLCIEIIAQDPGSGYFHPLAREDVVGALRELPRSMLERLNVVELSAMTFIRSRFPSYGMHWGNTIYLFPVVTSREELFVMAPPHPFRNETVKFGGKWDQISASEWRLSWTAEALRRYYSDCILPHELAHLNDDRNTNFRDRERYAEHMAVLLGKPCESYSHRKSHSRHGRKRRR